MTLRQTDYRATERMLPPPADPKDNIRASLARGLPFFSPALFPHDGTAVICGSGPSLVQFAAKIQAERDNRRPIWAVKGAHDWLCEQGIEPDVFVSCEAKPRLENVQRKNKRTLYLLSSRCSPDLFDWLADCNVMMWHSYSDREAPMQELVGAQLVGGGTTSGLRAVTLAWLSGFAKFILYGFDSCLAEDKRKRYDSGIMHDAQIVDRICGGRKFLCNGAMAMQADEFQEYYKLLPGVTFDIKGDGLLAAIVRQRKKMGLPA